MSSDSRGSPSSTDNDHPFRLRRVDLKYFKSVDYAKVDLSPLSIIVGANSSGKSTLLQPVLAVCQAARARGKAGEVLLNGDLQQLGTYREVKNFRVNQFEKRYQKFLQNISVFSRKQYQELEDSEWGATPDSLEIAFRIVILPRTIDWSISIIEDDTDTLFAQLFYVEVIIADEEGYAYIRCDSNRQVTVIQLLDCKKEDRGFPPLSSSELDEIFAQMEGNGAKWSVTWKGPNPEDQSQEPPSLMVRDMVGSRVYFRVRDGFYLEEPKLIDDLPISQLIVQIRDKYKGGNRWERNFLVEEYRVSFSPDEVNWSRPLIVKISDLIAEVFGSKVAYLGPLRATPREMAQSDLVSGGTNLGNRGEHTAAVLDSVRDDVIRVPLPDGYESRVPLGDALNGWLKWFGLADDATVQRVRRTIDLSVNPPGAPTSVDLSSVGVGVSQVLPVILLCLLSEPADLLILEQPELHLHPALQKRMADFLLAFVRCGRQILVETHSDHLVNALRTQVVFDPTDETRKLVKLIFAEQNDGITTYRESEINEYGGLSEDWPDGFLDISAKSAQDLVRQSLRKRIQRRGQGANGES